MTILFTGADGFLGKNVIPVLRQKKFQIETLSFRNSDYNVDLSKESPNLNIAHDIIFHAAGKAHTLPKTEAEKQSFFDVNLNGTKNLCRSLESSGLPKFFFFISTVAVYGIENGENITESTPLKGNTPYAESKKLAEEFLVNWSEKNGVILYVLRPSLIAGKNAPGNLGDMISAIKKNRYANIDGGKARKSIFWATDFVQIIEKGIKGNGGIYNVCDDEQPNFYAISKKIASKLQKKAIPNIPFFLVKSAAVLGDFFGSNFPINSIKLDKITNSLTFCNLKIKSELGFEPTNVLENLEI